MSALSLVAVTVDTWRGPVPIEEVCVEGPGVHLLAGGSAGQLLPVALGTKKCLTGRVELLDQAVDDLEPTDLRRLRSRCGVVTHRLSLIGNLSLRDNVLLPLRYHRGVGTESEAVDRALAATGLTGIAHARPSEVSPSQRRLTALVRALSGEPKILLVENPLDGMDAPHGTLLLTLLRQASEELPVVIAVRASAAQASRAYEALPHSLAPL